MGENKLGFWKDGEYAAEGGYFVRNNLKEFMQKIIDSGKEPVGIIVDLKSFNLEVIVKTELNELRKTTTDQS
jgi:hypothetical protein